MFEFHVRGIVQTGQQTLDTAISDLMVVTGNNGPVLLAVSGHEGGLVSYSLSENALPQHLDQIYFETFSVTGKGPSLALYETGTGHEVLISGLTTGGVTALDIDGLGQIGTLQNITGATTGNSLPLIAFSEDGRVFLTSSAEDGFRSYRIDNIDNLTNEHHITDGPETLANNPGALTTLSVEGSEFLLLASQTEFGLTAYSLENMFPIPTDTIGPQDGLGIMVPTDIATASINGQSFIILASVPNNGEAGALSVISLGADGQLTPVDHLLDTRDTRFGQVQVVETISVNGFTFVTAGGGDMGISLFILLPDGRLQHLDSLADSLDTGLSGITAIELVIIGGELQVYVTSDRDAGLTILTVDLSDLGYMQTQSGQGGAVTGSDSTDLVVGTSADDLLQAGGGDDILTDGAGEDTMMGGNGRDIFVPVADGETDIITDFDPNNDRLDLTGWAFLYEASTLQITETNDGARVSWRDELLIVNSVDGQRLNVDDLRAAIDLDVNRNFHIPSLSLTGNSGNDSLEGSWGVDTLTGLAGNDTLDGGIGNDLLLGGTGNGILDGGEGVDTASYADADNNVSVDIRFDGRSTQGAGRDSFISIENVTGSDFNDRLSGDSAANVLDGGTDNDTLRGQGGEDTLIGGEGDDNLRAGNDADVLRGDAGSDTLIGLSGDDELTGGIGDDFLFGGRDADTLFGNEGDDRLRGNQGNDVLEGGEGADDLRGGSGNDVLLGGADDDFMIGESGADTLDGGAGNDVLRGGFGDAPDGVRDTFVFAEGYDFDTIRDFENGTDLIDVQAFGFGSFAEVQALAEDRPSGLRIDFGGGDVLFINDVTLADLDQSDVIL